MSVWPYSGRASFSPSRRLACVEEGLNHIALKRGNSTTEEENCIGHVSRIPSWRCRAQICEANPALVLLPDGHVQRKKEGKLKMHWARMPRHVPCWHLSLRRLLRLLPHVRRFKTNKAESNIVKEASTLAMLRTPLAQAMDGPGTAVQRCTAKAHVAFACVGIQVGDVVIRFPHFGWKDVRDLHITTALDRPPFSQTPRGTVTIPSLCNPSTSGRDSTAR